MATNNKTLPTVQAKELSASYGQTTIFKDLTFELTPGVTVVAGPNGSGKSTLLKTLATVYKPASGTVLLNGHNVADRAGLRSARRSLGYLPQEPGFPSEVSVEDMLSYSAWLQDIPRGQHADAIDRVCESLDLGGFRSQKIGKLSGGMRQRAFLGQALIHDPSIVLLDEPTAAVDATHSAEFRENLRVLGQSRCIVMTSHLVDDIERLAERVLILMAGRGIVHDGTPSEMLEKRGLVEELPGERPYEQALRALATAGRSA